MANGHHEHDMENGSPRSASDGPSPSRLRPLSIDEILTLPDPKWLLKPLFAQGALVVVYGPSGSGKSFLALDWALSIASGSPWLGNEVIGQGPVAYVVGEGKGGIRKRLVAWLREHGAATVPKAFFILEPVQLLDNHDVSLLLGHLAPLRPVLVVLDTLAMCFSGDENHPKDMSLAVAAAKRIARETGATVILVHHTGKRGLEERGHSALRAAADTMVLVETKGKDLFGGTAISISNTKQKDEEEFTAITVRLTPVTVGMTDKGEELTSCVLEASETEPLPQGDLNTGEAQALAVLVNKFPEGARTEAWRGALKGPNGDELPARTYHNYREKLLKLGLVEMVRMKFYRATDEGKALVRPATDQNLAAVEACR